VVDPRLFVLVAPKDPPKDLGNDWLGTGCTPQFGS
jgi:hypothetical protein